MEVKITIINNTKYGLQFPLYDHLIEQKYSLVSASILSKSISTTIYYPFDLIRINQRNSKLPISIIDVAKMLVRGHGIYGLYRGVLLYNMISTPNFVIMMSVRNQLEKLIKEQ